MAESAYEQLSWRERQVMDALIELGAAGAQEVRERLPDPPSYSTVRAMLAKLERKGLVRHEERELRYVYSPAVSVREVRDSALARLVRVFFEGSAARAVTGMVDLAGELSDGELEAIERAIESAREERRT